MAASLAIRDKDDIEPALTADAVGRTLGPAIDQAAEALRDRAAKLPLAFAFQWRGRNVAVTVGEDGEGAMMHLRLALGDLPYTAEDHAFRTQLLYLQARRSDLPLGAIEVDGNQSTAFVARVPLPSTVTGSGIVIAVVQALLRIALSAWQHDESVPAPWQKMRKVRQ